LKQGLGQAVVEFETVKKITFVILSIVPAFIGLSYIVAKTAALNCCPLLSSPAGYVLLFFYSVGLQLTVVGGCGVLMYGLIILRKESRFHLSKVCLTIALSKKGVLEQLYYFNKGLQEYNKYLKRRLRHQIKDIDKIFSKVSLLDNDAKNKVICSLSDSFKTENDKLAPGRYISSELMKSEDIESFLIPESLKSQLKTVGAFLAALIPIVISIITLYYTAAKPPQP
jgi:hypothetical protein